MIFISQSVHQRSRERPYGNPEEPRLPNANSLNLCFFFVPITNPNPKPQVSTPPQGVLIANRIATRFCLLLYLATVRRVWSAIEQPASSVLKHIPLFTFLRDVLNGCTCDAGWDVCSLHLVMIKLLRCFAKCI